MGQMLWQYCTNVIDLDRAIEFWEGDPTGAAGAAGPDRRRRSRPVPPGEA